MPVCAFPLLIFQNTAPSLCSRTAGSTRAGALRVPRPSRPWQLAHRCAKIFAPPAAVSGRPASGLIIESYSAGAVHSGSRAGV
jgi:hypothetical protein